MSYGFVKVCRKKILTGFTFLTLFFYILFSLQYDMSEIKESIEDAVDKIKRVPKKPENGTKVKGEGEESKAAADYT